MNLATRESVTKMLNGANDALTLIDSKKTYSVKGSEQIKLIKDFSEWIEDIHKLYDIIDELKLQLKAKPKTKIVYRGTRK